MQKMLNLWTMRLTYAAIADRIILVFKMVVYFEYIIMDEDPRLAVVAIRTFRRPPALHCYLIDVIH